MLKQQARTIAALLYAADLSVTLATLPVAYLLRSEIVPLSPAVVFRWRERTEGSGQLKPLLPRIRNYARIVKGRTAAEAAVTEWLPATETIENIRQRLQANAAAPLDLPAFRTGCGTAREQQQHLQRILHSGVPFAIFTRCSLTSLAAPDESELPVCVANTPRFSDLPARIRAAAAARDCLLRHVLVFWDDFDRNPLLKYQ